MREVTMRSANVLLWASVCAGLGLTPAAARAAMRQEDPASPLGATASPESDALERLETVSLYGGAQLAAQYAALYVMQPPNWKHYGNSVEPTYVKFESNFERNPIFEPERLGGGGPLGVLQADGDSWITNVVGHGLQGSEIYLRMRRHGFDWFSAALAGAVHSTVWEYGIEGWNETPSAWDLAYTPVGGMLFGELRYHVLAEPEDHPWYVRALVDPLGELTAAFE
jgi:hypothetical protein